MAVSVCNYSQMVPAGEVVRKSVFYKSSAVRVDAPAEVCAVLIINKGQITNTIDRSKAEDVAETGDWIVRCGA